MTPCLRLTFHRRWWAPRRQVKMLPQRSITKWTICSCCSNRRAPIRESKARIIIQTGRAQRLRSSQSMAGYCTQGAPLSSKAPRWQSMRLTMLEAWGLQTVIWKFTKSSSLPTVELHMHMAQAVRLKLVKFSTPLICPWLASLLSAMPAPTLWQRLD